MALGDISENVRKRDKLTLERIEAVWGKPISMNIEGRRIELDDDRFINCQDTRNVEAAIRRNYTEAPETTAYHFLDIERVALKVNDFKELAKKLKFENPTHSMTQMRERATAIAMLIQHEHNDHTGVHVRRVGKGMIYQTNTAERVGGICTRLELDVTKFTDNFGAIPVKQRELILRTSDIWIDQVPYVYPLSSEVVKHMKKIPGVSAKEIEEVA